MPPFVRQPTDRIYADEKIDGNAKIRISVDKKRPKPESNRWPNA